MTDWLAHRLVDLGWSQIRKVATGRTPELNRFLQQILACLVLVLMQRLCTVQYGRLRGKFIVAVAVDHDVTAANGSGAIGRAQLCDAGSEAVDVFPDVVPAAAKSGKNGMVGKKITLDTSPCCGLLLERGSLTETGPAPRWS